MLRPICSRGGTYTSCSCMMLTPQTMALSQNPKKWHGNPAKAYPPPSFCGTHTQTLIWPSWSHSFILPVRPLNETTHVPMEKINNLCPGGNYMRRDWVRQLIENLHSPCCEIHLCLGGFCDWCIYCQQPGVQPPLTLHKYQCGGWIILHPKVHVHSIPLRQDTPWYWSSSC